MDIYNIEQLLPFVRQKPEFIVIDKGDYQVIDYVYQDQNTFDIPELMECRGIKFCRQGLILARPFRKFFNYGERGADLPAHRPHVITEKLDGPMIHPLLIDNKDFFLMTRKGHTDVAKKAERYIMSTDVAYIRFCKAMLRGQWTPIFEYTGPNNRIVLRYEQEDMRLLAIRHTIHGTLMDREMMVAHCHPYGVPLVPVLTMSLTGKVAEFIKHTRELVGAEGYVIYFDDGYMVKIKAEDYVLKHRALDDLGSKKKVVALCAQGFMDDVIPILSEPDAEELMEFNDALQREIAGHVNVVHNLVSRYELLKADVRTEQAGGARKQFAILTEQSHTPSHLRSAAFAAIDGKDPRLAIIKFLIRNHETVVTKWRGE